MIRINKNQILIQLCMALSVVVYLGQIMQIDMVASICFALSIACVVVIYTLQVVQTQRIKVSDLLVVLLMAVAIMMAGIRVDFDYYKPAIIVFCTIICIDISPKLQADKQTRQWIVTLTVIAVAVTNVMYYWGGLRYKYHGTTTLVSLNFINPNLATLWLTCFFLILASRIAEQETTFRKLLLGACCFSLVPLLSVTGSRACIIALAFYVIMEPIMVIFRVRELPNWFVFLVTISPILVFVLYMYVIIPFADLFSQVFSFAITTGKNLTSRWGLWKMFEEDFWNCFLVGQYAGYYSGQAHNALVTLCGRFGMIFVLLVCQKFYRAVKKLRYAKMQMPLCAAWVIGCFETAFFTGASGIYLMFLIFPLLSSVENGTNVKLDNK